jgi:DNA-binding transcriptional LysR family regulator
MLNVVDLSRVDLNLLVLFEAVHEERHVGRAAEKLCLTASAVSHGLRRLRQLLNDPLFLRTPKGVVPTARAAELAGPICGALAQVRSVISTAAPFDPATSTRRFVIGAPDAVSAVVLPPLLDALRQAAPGIAISIRQLLAEQGQDGSPEHAWRPAFAELDAREIDIAIIPGPTAPDRFFRQHLYDEDFVVAVRAGHPLAKGLKLANYCDAQHLVVSATGDPYGFVDGALSQVGRTRRTTLTVPNFMFALSVLAVTDLVGAVPRSFAERHAKTFGVVALEPPLMLGKFSLNAVVPKPAMMDAGVAWLCGLLLEPGRPRPGRRSRSS